jgi:hypothetical protein
VENRIGGKVGCPETISNQDTGNFCAVAVGITRFKVLKVGL